MSSLGPQGIQERWEAAAHRIQTSIGFGLAIDFPWLDERLRNILKHQRVGIDTVKADNGALIGLLIKKGIITQEEWAEAAIEGLEAEAERQQEWLQEKMGKGNPDLKIHTL